MINGPLTDNAFSLARYESFQDDSTLHVSHNVTAFEFYYEPFYAALDSAPAHDERFVGYGYTRSTQVYRMHVEGWRFAVLSPVFAVHLGMVDRKLRPVWRERQNLRNRERFAAFRREALASVGIRWDEEEGEDEKTTSEDANDESQRPLA